MSQTQIWTFKEALGVHYRTTASSSFDLQDDEPWHWKPFYFLEAGKA